MGVGQTKVLKTPGLKQKTKVRGVQAEVLEILWLFRTKNNKINKTFRRSISRSAFVRAALFTLPDFLICFVFFAKPEVFQYLCLDPSYLFGERSEAFHIIG